MRNSNSNNLPQLGFTNNSSSINNNSNNNSSKSNSGNRRGSGKTSLSMNSLRFSLRRNGPDDRNGRKATNGAGDISISTLTGNSKMSNCSASPGSLSDSLHHHHMQQKQQMHHHHHLHYGSTCEQSTQTPNSISRETRRNRKLKVLRFNFNKVATPTLNLR